jgi:hypothetical protein
MEFGVSKTKLLIWGVILSLGGFGLTIDAIKGEVSIAGTGSQPLDALSQGLFGAFLGVVGLVLLKTYYFGAAKPRKPTEPQPVGRTLVRALKGAGIVLAVFAVFLLVVALLR